MLPIPSYLLLTGSFEQEECFIRIIDNFHMFSLLLVSTAIYCMLSEPSHLSTFSSLQKHMAAAQMRSCAIHGRLSPWSKRGLNVPTRPLPRRQGLRGASGMS